MSFHVTSICTDHQFGSAPRKQVITFLADKASDDGSGIWCSKGTVARSTELSKSTVKRVFQQFLNEGILTETGKRKNTHGFTATYCINLDKVAELPLTKDLSDTTGFTVPPFRVDPQEGSPRTPNHPLTILEPGSTLTDVPIFLQFEVEADQGECGGEIYGLSNHRIGEGFISGGVRDCADGPESITADASWKRLRITRFEVSEYISQSAGAMECRE